MRSKKIPLLWILIIRSLAKPLLFDFKVTEIKAADTDK